MPSSTISSKGQVTVPIEVRRRLGLKSGDRVHFDIAGDTTVIRPALSEDDPFAEFVGKFPAFKSRDEINAWIADMRDDDEPYE